MNLISEHNWCDGEAVEGQTVQNDEEWKFYGPSKASEVLLTTIDHVERYCLI